jgi:secreted trypsin-like serine protease
VVSGTGPGRHVVMIVGTRGKLCSGTALARDLVLTAGHCVAPAATYRVVPPGTGIGAPGLPLKSIVVNPRYSPNDYASGRVTADVALLKLEAALPPNIYPAPLATPNVAAGDRFVIAGYGPTVAGSDTGAGTPRAAAMVATGKPGSLQIRLVDPATRGERAGLGACYGDSGGPAFIESGGVYSVIGVISWSTGPAGAEGCGGMTGVTPLVSHRGWILETARRLGSPLSP